MQDYERQIRKVVRAYMNQHWQSEESATSQSRIPSRFRRYAVILDEDLPGVEFLAASDDEEDRNEQQQLPPNATICRYLKGKRQYVQTKDRLRVEPHDAEDHDKDTHGVAIPVDGHYWFFGACDPLTDRPDPPWLEEAS